MEIVNRSIIDGEHGFLVKDMEDVIWLCDFLETHFPGTKHVYHCQSKKEFLNFISGSLNDAFDGEFCTVFPTITNIVDRNGSREDAVNLNGGFCLEDESSHYLDIRLLAVECEEFQESSDDIASFFF